MQSGGRYRGVFTPRRVDDLKPDALPLVGCEGVFEALWVIEDGEYAGEWAMRFPLDWPLESAAWAPHGDVTLREG